MHLTNDERHRSNLLVLDTHWVRCRLFPQPKPLPLLAAPLVSAPYMFSREYGSGVISLGAALNVCSMRHRLSVQRRTHRQTLSSSHEVACAEVMLLSPSLACQTNYTGREQMVVRLDRNHSILAIMIVSRPTPATDG